MNDVTAVADQIFRELSEPEELTIPIIAFWLQSNIGALNNLLNTSILIDENEEFDPQLSPEQTSIFKHIYFIHYFTRLIRSSLGASAYDWSEIEEGDSHVRRVSRNEIAKTYQLTRNALQKELDDLVYFYKQNRCPPVSIGYESLDYYLNWRACNLDIGG